MVKGPLHAPPPPPPPPPRTEKCEYESSHPGRWIVRPALVRCGRLAVVGDGWTGAVGGIVFSLAGGHPLGRGRTIWIGLAKSICASFNRSTATVSVLPPMSILKVLGPVSMTLYGPV